MPGCIMAAMHGHNAAQTADFPRDFLWGAATAAHQVEGNNIYNDWWAWEQAGNGKEPSGNACGHYGCFRDDFDLARGLNHSAHRFSIEWSRIEPEEGVFCAEALGHYCDVVAALRDRGIEPIVTLSHFTLPAWFAREGGWLSPLAQKRFVRFVGYVVAGLADKVTWWVTINEPNVYAYHAYAIGAWPPQEHSLRKSRAVMAVLREAHCAAYRAIHAIYRDRGLNMPQVSIAQNVQVFQPCTAGVRNSLAVALRHRLFNLDLIERCVKANALDYIGINYYSRSLAHVKGWSINSLLLDGCSGHSALPKNSLGWDIYPEGIFTALMAFKRYNLPLMILENGICTDDDAQRWKYIRAHISQVRRAMEHGARVKGYIYWSLIDNFEWDKGFAPRFGLIGIDYATLARTVRPSAMHFAEVCSGGALT